MTLKSGFGSKAEEIEWRRSKIIELKSQGLDQREIAKVLQVTPTLISYDIQCMRKEAKETVKDYTTKELPLQFRVVIKATWNAIKEYWNISQNTHDNREKMQALEQYLECHRKLCSMLGLETTMEVFIGGLDEEKEKHQYKEGEMIYPKPGEQFTPYVYHSPEFIRRENEKFDKRATYET